MSFKHGGNIVEIARGHNIDESSIIDFSASINPLGISPLAREAVMGAIDSVSHYPDTRASKLVSALSCHHDISPENIAAGNGSTEFIYLIPRVFRPKKALIITPSFSEYEAALTRAGCTMEYFALEENDNFILRIVSLFSRLEDGYDMLWFANPGNPTGNVVNLDDMRKIIHTCRRLGIFCVVDEAFIDFCEEESVKKEVVCNDRLIVLRSLTKFYAIAGLRVGFIFGSEGTIKEVARWKEPWSLNILGEAAAAASLQDDAYRSETLSLVREERRFLLEGIKNIPLMRPVGADANYILVRLYGEMSSAELADKLLKEHLIMIRDCSNFRGLDGSYMRIAVRGRVDNLKLIKVLETLYA